MKIGNRLRAVVVLLGGMAMTLAMASAPAAAAPMLNVEYDASGSAYIASTDSSIDLGPSVLTSEVDFATGEFTGTMPLPGTRTQFKVAGFIPVTADVAFEDAAPIVGTISDAPTQSRVDAVASYHIRLSNIKIAGFPTITGSHCRTVNPVSITIESPAEGNFNLFTGGDVGGSFSIGDFQNCGLNTWLINLLIPGSGNSIDITIGEGRLVS